MDTEKLETVDEVLDDLRDQLGFVKKSEPKCEPDFKFSSLKQQLATYEHTLLWHKDYEQVVTITGFNDASRVINMSAVLHFLVLPELQLFMAPLQEFRMATRRELVACFGFPKLIESWCNAYLLGIDSPSTYQNLFSNILPKWNEVTLDILTGLEAFTLAHTEDVEKQLLRLIERDNWLREQEEI